MSSYLLKIRDGPHYQKERWRILCTLFPLVIMGAISGWLFYANYLAMLICGMLGLLSYNMALNRYCDYCDQRLLDEFNDLTIVLITGLQSGKSLENILLKLCDEESLNNWEQFSFMRMSLGSWREKLALGERGTAFFKSLGKESGIQEIENFSDLLHCCSVHGSSQVEVIRMFHHYLREQRIMSKRIEVVITQKRLEHQLVGVAPLVFLAYLRATTSDFLEPLYTTFSGRLIMTFALATLIGMWYLGLYFVKGVRV